MTRQTILTTWITVAVLTFLFLAGIGFFAETHVRPVIAQVVR